MEMFISIYKFYCVAHYVLLRMYHVYRVTLAELFSEEGNDLEMPCGVQLKDLWSSAVGVLVTGQSRY